MKTAEEILKSKLDGKITFVNNPDYTFNKVIEAMEEYRLQSHPSPMSAEPTVQQLRDAAKNNPDTFLAGALYVIDNYKLNSHPMSAEQVEELGEKYADSKYDKAIHLIGWSNTKHGFIAGYNAATTPSVKAEGWVSVEDGLPEIPPPYYDKDNEVHKPIQVEVWCFDGSEVYEDWFYFNSKPVGCTHWKYKEAIPSPPKQK